MNKLLFLITSAFIVSCGSMNPKWPSESFAKKYNYQEVILESEIKENPTFFVDKIDKSPMYPAGVQGIMSHIGQQFKYPEEARKNGIQGKIYVSFLIDIDGVVKDVEVVKTPNEIFNEEAIRVIQNMERWIPAKLGGEYVKFRYTVPINLKLN